MRLIDSPFASTITSLIVPFVAIAMIAGCASQVVTPRAYLDEDTAATITVVAQPWIFNSNDSSMSGNDRDFLNMFAVDVNRMGSHRQYLAVLQSIPASQSVAPTLELQAAGKTVSLQHTVEDPRKLGIAKPLAPSYSITARWWYFPVDKEVLTNVGRGVDLQAALITDKRVQYSLWRDGSHELAELTAVIP